MPYPKVHSFHSVRAIQTYLDELGVEIPMVDEMSRPGRNPMASPIRAGDLTIGNRFAVHPMEGWDATPDGRPTESLLRRWWKFGVSGAGLVWGGEAYAIQQDARANPLQLYYQQHADEDLNLLYETVTGAHRDRFGSTDGLVVGLQLTHSGRFCRPDPPGTLQPRIAYAHPVLNPKFGLPMDYPVLSDGEIQEIIARYAVVARTAWNAGFHFVDVKHCHGYLGHEMLSAFTRPGPYGGSFENRTRFLREIVSAIRRDAPGLAIGVRISAIDLLPYKPDPETSRPGKPGAGVPDDIPGLRPYVYGFGVDPQSPADTYDMAEPIRFLELLEELGIHLVNITAGSPYYNPHVQRPAYFPPSDGYQPPEDPLVGVARHMAVTGALKKRFPNLVLVGTGYTYLQEFLPMAAEAAVAQGLTDMVGVGRMVLSYPTLPADVLTQGELLHPKQICRTFSDCTTAPRNHLISGCYPLDDYYKNTEQHEQLRVIKRSR